MKDTPETEKTIFIGKDANRNNETKIQNPRMNWDALASDKTVHSMNRQKNTVDDEDVTRFSPVDKLILSEKGTQRSPLGNELVNKENLLKNRFVLEQLLGAGGMGVVYKAKDLLKVEAQDKDPYVAIKVLTDEFKTHPEAFIALQRESRKTQRIAHPNIVTVFDFDKDGDTVFMTMEFLDGRPLDKLIAQYRSVGLPHDEVIKIVEGMSAALAYAHAQRIIHSDFKPGNIFVNNQGVAKVIDFGIARAVAKVEHRDESVDDKTVFDAGNLGALTPAYASLEMLEGKSPDVTDDIYALGCITYELFTGNHPFNRVHADEAFKNKLKPKKISGINKHQWRAIEQALSFKREQRTQSVELFFREFSKKPKSYWLIMFLSASMMGGLVYGYLHFKPEPVQMISEDQVRLEVEQKLRLEMLQKQIDDTLKNSTFSEEWESNLWQLLKDAVALMGDNHTWYVGIEKDLISQYVETIHTGLNAKDFDSTLRWINNVKRYRISDGVWNELFSRYTILKKEQEDLLAAMAEKERQQEEERRRVASNQPIESPKPKVAEVDIRVKGEFDAALNTVNAQLTCRSSIDMRDFEIAIVKLRSLDAPRYKSVETEVINNLGKCIQKIGDTFPDRAELIKRQALRLFDNNAILQRISIIAKDSCSDHLAGLGARGIAGTCKDKFNGVTKPPLLVVIPAKGALKSFSIGKYEVTNEEWNEYCAATQKCDQKSDAPQIPVVNVQINQITEYAKWLSEKSGRVYRLPTQAEWFHAASSTQGSVDPNRNCKLSTRGIQKGSELVRTSLGQQNAWGLVNVVGNAQEIVVNRPGVFSVVGGSYDTDMSECNLTTIKPYSGAADNFSGFRIVRELR